MAEAVKNFSAVEEVRRLQLGSNEHPSMLILDAQSVKTTSNGEQRGFDGKKR